MFVRVLSSSVLYLFLLQSIHACSGLHSIPFIRRRAAGPAPGVPTVPYSGYIALRSADTGALVGRLVHDTADYGGYWVERNVTGVSEDRFITGTIQVPVVGDKTHYGPLNIAIQNPQTFWKYPYLGIAGDWLLEVPPEAPHPNGHIITATNITPEGSSATLVGNEAFQITGTSTGSQSMVWHFDTATRRLTAKWVQGLGWPYIDLFLTYNVDSGAFLAYGYRVPPETGRIVDLYLEGPHAL